MNAEAAFLRIEGVSKRFGAMAAVDTVTLEIGRSEFFALLGPSGCGKTTLLRMIAGLEVPDAGKIVIDGTDITDAPPERRPTNMVFQSYAIFPHLNVFDNIAYGLRKARLSRDALTKRVGDALSMMRLEGLERRMSNELSGGQRQRVALARALVRRPKVLLLDEPLGALDKRLREAMQTELRQLQKQVGITFLFVTHDQEEALSMSDRIAVMSAGHMLQVASPQELYERPICREVADFIGSMNFFEASVISATSESAIVDAGVLGEFEIPRQPAGLNAGAKCLLALRPERIVISDKGSVAGTLVAVTYLGERSHFRVRVQGLEKPIFVSAANTGDMVSLQPGSAVRLGWEPEAMILLGP